MAAEICLSSSLGCCRPGLGAGARSARTLNRVPPGLVLAIPSPRLPILASSPALSCRTGFDLGWRLRPDRCRLRPAREYGPCSTVLFSHQ